MMKKLFLSISRSLLLAVLLLGLLVCAGCAQTLPEETANNNPTSIGSKPAGLTVAVITAEGDADGEAVWQAVQQYAEQQEIAAEQHKVPSLKSTHLRAGISSAVSAGAQLVIMSGSVFEVALFESQDVYSDVQFVLLDGEPHAADFSAEGAAANVTTISFAEEQLGFLAGYATQIEGYDTVGFIGGLAVEEVVACGTGFLQGITYACQQLSSTCTVHYNYSGAANVLDPVQLTASTWYTNGTSCLFSYGGVESAVLAAAKQANSLLISAENADYSEDEAYNIAIRIKKDYPAAALWAVQRFAEDALPGGQDIRLGLAEGCLGIDFAQSRLSRLSEEQYNALVQKIISSAISITRITGEQAVLQNLISSSVTLVVE